MRRAGASRRPSGRIQWAANGPQVRSGSDYALIMPQSARAREQSERCEQASIAIAIRRQLSRRPRHSRAVETRSAAEDEQRHRAGRRWRPRRASRRRPPGRPLRATTHQGRPACLRSATAPTQLPHRGSRPRRRAGRGRPGRTSTAAAQRNWNAPVTANSDGERDVLVPVRRDDGEVDRRSSRRAQRELHRKSGHAGSSGISSHVDRDDPEPCSRDQQRCVRM